MVGRPSMRLRNITVGAVLCIALFIAAAPAYAASSAGTTGYSEPAGSVLDLASRFVAGPQR